MIARRSIDVNGEIGRYRIPLRLTTVGCFRAAPLSDSGTSTQPVKRFFAFHLGPRRGGSAAPNLAHLHCPTGKATPEHPVALITPQLGHES